LTRLVLGLIGDQAVAEPRPRTLEDRWIVSRVVRTQREGDARMVEFEFSRLALSLRDFVHADLSDWYMEVAKRRPVDEDLAATLLWVLRETLIFAHPVLPFVTEQLWAALPGVTTMLAAERAEVLDEALLDTDAEAEFSRVIEVTSAVRAWREKVGVPARRVLRARVPLSDEGVRVVESLARLETEGGDGDEACAVVNTAGAVVEILEQVAPAAELARARDAQRRRLESEISRAQSRLADQMFVTNAPGHLVAAERVKLRRLEYELGAL
jgi:valyl-tRNA synthetase